MVLVFVFGFVWVWLYLELLILGFFDLVGLMILTLAVVFGLV